MKKRLLITLAVILSVVSAASAKTLVVYYSYTNNVHSIVTDLLTQIDADFDRLTIYNAGGQKILETSSASVAYPFQPGCYVVQLKKGNKMQTTKLMVK